jgi:hypothetical protein
MAARKLTAAERSDMADEARRVMRAYDELDTPTYEDALAMDLDEMLAEYERRGVEIDVDFLREVVRTSLTPNTLAAFDRIEFSEARTVAAEASTRKAVDRAVAVVARDAIRQAGQAALFESDERDELDAWFVWIGVGDGCESCLSLHGTVQRRDMWDGIEPGTPGVTLCGDNCRCRLMPCSAPPAGEGGLRREEFRP